MELQTLDINNISKAIISEKADQVVQLVKDGITPAIDTKILCKAYLDYFKKIDAAINGEAIDEADNFANKTEMSKFGVKFELSNTGERLDYEKDADYKDLKDQLKAREELLKAAVNTKGSLFDEDGTEVEKVPVKSISKRVIKISL